MVAQDFDDLLDEDREFRLPISHVPAPLDLAGVEVASIDKVFVRTVALCFVIHAYSADSPYKYWLQTPEAHGMERKYSARPRNGRFGFTIRKTEICFMLLCFAGIIEPVRYSVNIGLLGLGKMSEDQEYTELAAQRRRALEIELEQTPELIAAREVLQPRDDDRAIFPFIRFNLYYRCLAI